MSVIARAGVLERATRCGLLVLDIDGVLLDPRPSFYAAALTTSLRAAREALGSESVASATQEDIDAFKAAGGWNDDFELAAGLAHAIVLREVRRMPIVGTARRSAGGLPVLLETVEAHLPDELRKRLEIKAIRNRCAASYAGRDRCEAMYGLDPAAFADLPESGLWALEPVLANGMKIRATGFALAFFTGRNAAEAAIAAERLELDVPIERRIVDDGARPKKPHPAGLHELARFSEGGPIVFVGDSVDDQNAARAFRAERPGTELIFVRVAGDSVRVAQLETALNQGADAVAAGLDDFLRALPHRDRRDDV